MRILMGVKATLSELAKKTSKVVRPVIHGNKTVELTNHGEVCAKLVPIEKEPGETSGAELARRLAKMQPEPKAAAAVAEAIQAMNEAD